MKIIRCLTNTSESDMWLIHGFTESGRYFSSALQKDFLASFNLFIPDLPGFGQSELPDELCVDAVVEELSQEILLRASCQHLYLVGHSLGGAIVVMLAKRLIDKGINPHVINIDGIFLEEKVGDSSVSYVFSYDHPEQFKAFVIDYWQQRIDQDNFLFRYLENIKLTPPKVLYAWAKEMMKLLENDKVLHVQQEIIKHTTFIYGTMSGNDKNINAVLALGINAISMPGCGHWPMLDAEEKFWSIIQSLIKN